MRCFLSHNKADKPVARSIGGHLTLSGLDVWFDEWEIRAGDSIPGKLNEGLEGFDAFVLLWSKPAERSDWVRQELHAAIMRAIDNKSAKIVPCRIDDAPLPALIADRRWIDFSNVSNGISELVEELTGVRTRRQRMMAIQAALLEMNIRWIEHPALNPMVCCPKCGATDRMEARHFTDHRNERLYGGLECMNCGWSDGGEM